MIENNRLFFPHLSQLPNSPVKKYTASSSDMLCSWGNRSAPLPIRKTCSLFSFTARASYTGFLTPQYAQP